MGKKEEPEEAWGAFMSRKAAEWSSAENLEGRNFLSKGLHKAVGSTLGSVADTVNSSGVEATW